MSVPDMPVVNWKTNLFFILCSQVLSLMAFSFAMSFAAYYIQDLGITDPKELKFWNGAFAASAPLALAVMGPIWGIIGDRHGRRLMMLRAYFCATIIIFLMGRVSNVQQLIALRVAQGTFTGTITASAVMVAVMTPKHRQGLALGFLQAGMLVGWLLGSSLGGYLADVIGYSRTISFGSGIMLLAALIVTFGVKEQFEAPAPEERASSWQGVKVAFPILVIIFFAAIARRFDAAFVPLVVQELNGGVLAGSATQMGKLTAVCCLTMTVASVSVGFMADKVSPRLITAIAALGAAVFAFIQFRAETFVALVLFRSGLMFFIGGMEPAFQTWLSRNTPENARGGVFGFSNTFKALGWSLASLGSTGVAIHYGIRSPFLLAAGLFLVMVPLVFIGAKRGDGIESVGATEPSP